MLNYFRSLKEVETETNETEDRIEISETQVIAGSSEMESPEMNIIDQLVFNVDIWQTLQLLQPSLAKHESLDVIELLNIKRKPAYNAKMQKNQ